MSSAFVPSEPSAVPPTAARAALALAWHLHLAPAEPALLDLALGLPLLDTTRARNELGWTPRHTFEDGLRETVDWYLDHRDWCEAIQAGRYDRERLGLGS